METPRRIALMIDGDNAQASLLGQMQAEVSKYGVMTIRRVYGDWTEPNMKSWKAVLHTYALQPFQQFSYTTGKNSTDSALIIDAMDILYTAGIDGFCIASSDSDYTRLATRIREKNLFVMGIGKSTTPRAFVSACDVFVYTENLKTEAETLAELEVKNALPIPQTEYLAETFTEVPIIPTSPATGATSLENLFQTAFELAAQEDGWAHLGTVGHFLRQNDPGFDPRSYGHKLLSQLVSELGEQRPDFIELDRRKNKSGKADFYIRLR